MKRLNLSEWAITHRALVLFMILLLGAAGVFSYLNLGRAEDPSFTIKVMVVNVAWPGATAPTGVRSWVCPVSASVEARAASAGVSRGSMLTASTV